MGVSDCMLCMYARQAVPQSHSYSQCNKQSPVCVASCSYPVCFMNVTKSASLSLYIQAHGFVSVWLGVWLMVYFVLLTRSILWS